MPWFRILIALVLSVYALSAYPIVLSQMLGPPPSELPSAPGVSAADRAALLAPFQELAAGQDQRFLAHAAPVLSVQDWTQSLTQARAGLPPGRISKSRLISWRIYAGTDGSRLTGIHEHYYPAHVVRAETILVRANASEPWLIGGLHLNLATNAELAANRFELENKPPVFLAVLAAIALTPIFMLITALNALFAKGLKLRWLWVLASIVGFGQIAVNSAIIEFSITPLSFLVFGAGATWSGSQFDPWILTWAAPIGAIAYWIFRPARRKAQADAAA